METCSYLSPVSMWLSLMPLILNWFSPSSTAFLSQVGTIYVTLVMLS